MLPGDEECNENREGIKVKNTSGDKEDTGQVKELKTDGFADVCLIRNQV